MDHNINHQCHHITDVNFEYSPAKIDFWTKENEQHSPIFSSKDPFDIDDFKGMPFLDLDDGKNALRFKSRMRAGWNRISGVIKGREFNLIGRKKDEIHPFIKLSPKKRVVFSQEIDAKSPETKQNNFVFKESTKEKLFSRDHTILCSTNTGKSHKKQEKKSLFARKSNSVIAIKTGLLDFLEPRNDKDRHEINELSLFQKIHNFKNCQTPQSGIYTYTLRRRSCHCNDCGPMPKLEKDTLWMPLVYKMNAQRTYSRPQIYNNNNQISRHSSKNNLQSQISNFSSNKTQNLKHLFQLNTNHNQKHQILTDSSYSPDILKHRKIVDVNSIERPTTKNFLNQKTDNEMDDKSSFLSEFKDDSLFIVRKSVPQSREIIMREPNSKYGIQIQEISNDTLDPNMASNNSKFKFKRGRTSFNKMRTPILYQKSLNENKVFHRNAKSTNYIATSKDSQTSNGEKGSTLCKPFYDIPSRHLISSQSLKCISNENNKVKLPFAIVKESELDKLEKTLRNYPKKGNDSNNSKVIRSIYTSSLTTQDKAHLGKVNHNKLLTRNYLPTKCKPYSPGYSAAINIISGNNLIGPKALPFITNENYYKSPEILSKKLSFPKIEDSQKQEKISNYKISKKVDKTGNQYGSPVKNLHDTIKLKEKYLKHSKSPPQTLMSIYRKEKYNNSSSNQSIPV